MLVRGIRLWHISEIVHTLRQPKIDVNRTIMYACSDCSFASKAYIGLFHHVRQKHPGMEYEISKVNSRRYPMPSPIVNSDITSDFFYEIIFTDRTISIQEYLYGVKILFYDIRDNKHFYDRSEYKFAIFSGARWKEIELLDLEDLITEWEMESPENPVFDLNWL